MVILGVYNPCPFELGATAHPTGYTVMLFAPLCGGAVEEPLVYQGGARAPLAIGKPRGREIFFVYPAPNSPACPAE